MMGPEAVLLVIAVWLFIKLWLKIVDFILDLILITEDP